MLAWAKSVRPTCLGPEKILIGSNLAYTARWLGVSSDMG